jgi:23S rRNA (adenine2503-C2)-methyltransferase
MSGLTSQVDPLRPETAQSVVERLRKADYEVIVSIGEKEENEIGSNCGQYVLNYLESGMAVKDGYSYKVETLEEV